MALTFTRLSLRAVSLALATNLGNEWSWVKSPESGEWKVCSLCLGLARAAELKAVPLPCEWREARARGDLARATLPKDSRSLCECRYVPGAGPGAPPVPAGNVAK